MNKIENFPVYWHALRWLEPASCPGLVESSCQSAPAAKNSGVVYNSRFDFATLYSYFQAHGADTDVGISYNDIRLGAYASGSYYFNRRLGWKRPLKRTRMATTTGLYDAQIGPIVRYNMNHFSLFAHGLVGSCVWPDRIPGSAIHRV